MNIRQNSFSYDGLKVQRLHYPMVLTKSWSKKKKKVMLKLKNKI